MVKQRVVVGLGNPGDKYRNNRHNAGILFTDFLADHYKNDQIVIANLGVFMNQSGGAVKELVKKYLNYDRQLIKTNLIVAHDDLDIPFGKFKIQQSSGPRLHNGVNSIETSLGTKDFLRIRIGIDNRQPDNWIEGEKYVLTNFNADELKELNEKVFEQIIKSPQLNTIFIKDQYA